MLTALPLHKLLLKRIQELELNQATPIQQHAIPIALQQQDLVASAETGSGKTFAFLLPTIDRLLRVRAPQSGTRVLILVPTRELARQIQKQAELLINGTDLISSVITGGQSFKYQRALFRKNPEIIIATPGRLLEHLEQGTPDFDQLEILILDEADRMLDMGFSEDVLAITDQCNRDRQTMLFSATLSQRGLGAMIEVLLRDPEIVTLSTVRDQPQHIRQQVIPADDNVHKRRLLAWLLQHESYEKALVFTNTRVQADALAPELRKQYLRTGVLHGEMSQDERNQVMKLLRQGTISILVATDVAARGLDIKGIDLVVNFQMARNGKEYVHRIGRTGRAGSEGLAISLISHQEWNLMTGIERYLRQSFEQRHIPEVGGKYRGPNRQKNSGKAAGKKRPPKAESKGNSKKAKQRLRDKKNVGKRRRPTTDQVASEAGNQPLRKRTVDKSKPSDP